MVHLLAGTLPLLLGAMQPHILLSGVKVILPVPMDFKMFVLLSLLLRTYTHFTCEVVVYRAELFSNCRYTELYATVKHTPIHRSIALQQNFMILNYLMPILLPPQNFEHPQRDILTLKH
jgi:hypothetical protein